MANLTRIEPAALKLLRKITISEIKPKLVFMTPELSPVWDYFRSAISSAPQGSVVTPGRSTGLFMFDEVTGGLLGVFCLSDMMMTYPFFEKVVGWDNKDTEDARGYPASSLKRKYINTVCLMRRCLPLYEFGHLTGGKLLTIVAQSKELIRSMELKYSFKYSVLIARTLHGKSSQYNRLPFFKYYGDDEKGTGLYLGELRKKGIAVISGEKPKLGKLCGPTFEEAIEHWKERWFFPRCERLGVTHLEFDPDRYRVSNFFNHGTYFGEDDVLEHS